MLEGSGIGEYHMEYSVPLDVIGLGASHTAENLHDVAAICGRFNAYGW